MAYLITGSSGFVGSSLCHRLAEHDQVYALYHDTPPDCAPRANIHLVSLADMGDLAGSRSIETVIHCAAHHPHSSVENTGSEHYLRVNCHLTKKIAEWANTLSACHFLYISSISVYGEVRSGCLDEDTPLCRPDLYGTTKYLGELIVNEASTAPLRLALRMPGIVGAACRHPWLCRVKERARQHLPIVIHNPDAAFNNVTDSDEIARFVRHIRGRTSPDCDVLNFGASEPVSIMEAVMKIIECTGSRSAVEINHNSGQPFHISTEKLSGTYGFIHQKTLDCIARFAAA